MLQLDSEPQGRWRKYPLSQDQTHGANTKKVRRYSVVRACGCTLKSMVISLEGALVGSTYRSNKTQHRDRINLEVAQSLNQVLGGCVDFQYALYDFFGSVDQR